MKSKNTKSKCSFRSRKRVTAEIIKKITNGLLATLTDVIVLESVVISEFLFNPRARTMGGLSYAVAKKLDILDGVEGAIDEKSYKHALYRAKEKGWIDKDFYPTKEGRARLERIIKTKYEQPKKWDGKWYVVIFDIPERKRGIRNVFREKLKALNFGMLQGSVWISPFPYLGDVEEIVKFYNLKPYVLYAISKKVGRSNSKELANQVWKLNGLNKKYKEFLEDYRSAKNADKIKLNKFKFEFLNILQLDPQLPFEILPQDWLGKRAYKTYRDILRSIVKA